MTANAQRSRSQLISHSSFVTNLSSECCISLGILQMQIGGPKPYWVSYGLLDTCSDSITIQRLREQTIG